MVMKEESFMRMQLEKQVSINDLPVIINEANISNDAVSNIYTDVVSKTPEIFTDKVNTGDLFGSRISINSNNSKNDVNQPDQKCEWASGGAYKGKIRVTVNEKAFDELRTVENVQSALGVHEYYGHGVLSLGSGTKTHRSVYGIQMQHSTYTNTTKDFKAHMKSNEKYYQNER
jgi:hypothetical protein